MHVGVLGAEAVLGGGLVGWKGEGRGWTDVHEAVAEPDGVLALGEDHGGGGVGVVGLTKVVSRKEIRNA